jgi:hypothetical protein
MRLSVNGGKFQDRSLWLLRQRASRPWQPDLHPFGECGNFVGAQFPFGRHVIVADVIDRLDQQAAVGIARYGRSLAAVTTLDNRRPRIKPQARLLFLLAVALQAIRE